MSDFLEGRNFNLPHLKYSNTLQRVGNKVSPSTLDHSGHVCRCRSIATNVAGLNDLTTSIAFSVRFISIFINTTQTFAYTFQNGWCLEIKSNNRKYRL